MSTEGSSKRAKLAHVDGPDDPRADGSDDPRAIDLDLVQEQLDTGKQVSFFRRRPANMITAEDMRQLSTRYGKLLLTENEEDTDEKETGKENLAQLAYRRTASRLADLRLRIQADAQRIVTLNRQEFIRQFGVNLWPEDELLNLQTGTEEGKTGFDGPGRIFSPSKDESDEDNTNNEGDKIEHKSVDLAKPIPELRNSMRHEDS